MKVIKHLILSALILMACCVAIPTFFFLFISIIYLCIKYVICFITLIILCILCVYFIFFGDDIKI